mgnify:CR=1 FL=1
MLPSAVKFIDGSDDIIEGLAMPFGGPADGRDLDGEFFDARTDFMLDFFKGRRPGLYAHGQDLSVRGAKVAEVTDFWLTEAGMWAQTQLDMRTQYAEAIRELVRRGALSFSSGAYPPLARIAKSGHIDIWPWIELSYTPMPANPLAAIATKAIKADGASRYVYLAEADAADTAPDPPRPRLLTAKAVWSGQYVAALPDSAFACIDSAGRHYPHHAAQGALDLPHLRAALSRIGDPSNTQCGKSHLLRHARAEGIGER